MPASDIHTQPNSISFQMRFIQQSLNNVAKEFGGIAVIARDYKEMWEIASVSPGPRIIIVYDGEEVRGPLEWAAVAGRVDRRYAVLVSRGELMTAHRAEGYTEQIGGTEAFMDLLEQIRDTCRVLLFDPSVTEASGFLNDPVDYHGIDPIAIDGAKVDAYLIRFSIGTQLGLVYESLNFTLAGAPNPASQLNLTDNGNSVTLNWTNNSPNITSTDVYRSPDGVTYTKIGTAAGTLATYTDLTVVVSTMYWYYVICNSTTGPSDKSNIVSIFV